MITDDPPDHCRRCQRTLRNDYGDRWCDLHGTVWFAARASDPVGDGLHLKEGNVRATKGNRRSQPISNALLEKYGDLSAIWWDHALTTGSDVWSEEEFEARLQEAVCEEKKGTDVKTFVSAIKRRIHVKQPT